MATKPGEYENIEHFISENPEWIDVNIKLPPDDTMVMGLNWMFGNFTIDTVYHSYGGWFQTHTPDGWWTEKVSHWKEQ